jgi:lipopolysaccharide/colanic/teichoic acid biosynthesis glycosyltransferase
METNMKAAKRFLDFTVALLGLIGTAPLQLALAVLVKLDSPGPVLYWGQRIGLGGRPFRMAKFRTMFADADRVGPAITGEDDHRITRLGRWLRCFHLDELPQLWHVLRGEMSLVGPRPEAPCYVAHYSAEQRHVLDVRPGITGLAQLQFRNEATILGPDATDEDYVNLILPYKVAVDLEYIARWSLGLDFRILWHTVSGVLGIKSLPLSEGGTLLLSRSSPEGS